MLDVLIVLGCIALGLYILGKIAMWYLIYDFLKTGAEVLEEYEKEHKND